MDRARFVRSLAGFALLAPTGRALAAELFAGDGSSGPVTAEPPPADLLRTLRARRSTQIARVQAYSRRGVFPRNLDFPGTPTPYFLDDRGVSCAVAFLMIQDGRRADVEALSATNNFVRVMDVSSGPIVDWVLGSGLTQEEAARIQPSYHWIDRPTPRPLPTPEEPGLVEQRRLRQHFATVVAELRRDAEASLAIAVDRFERARARG